MIDKQETLEDWERLAARIASIPLVSIGAGSLYVAALNHALAPWEVSSIAAFVVIGAGSLVAGLIAWRSRAGAKAALLWFGFLLTLWLSRPLWIRLFGG